MKLNRSFIVSFVLLIVVAAVYRVIPVRPLGLLSFAPQIAMALFGGALIKDKKWAFALPIFSMFLSDLLFHALYKAGITTTAGFYNGQLWNYFLFALMVVIGFLIKKINVLQVGLAALIAPTIFFVLSNFGVWLFGGGWGHPQTAEGLLLTYKDAIPFYQGSVYATLFFSLVLFGGYFLLNGSKKIELAQN
ncbi:DUF6580 family putative transport protein [Flavihumibacter sp. CACIAM 22H1]|uniref:DUF6580 family putative transport protein n=1 Tax=Flavihumibacter sp. CACIAM 22H1 TaxID=1812911 RepID=UPI0007A8F305|nr:DUF6580 family putative transport protein [Flavihumibacter sp. CACIAM 22H1]KYP15094.1 MAG: hypothetical protein A1D16_02595 [Flavihumibacter sp. CACIAM 22H1]